MKMSDYFSLPVKCKKESARLSGMFSSLGIKFGVVDNFCANYVSKAINNHDRLTEENEKLREALQWTHDKLIAEGKRYGASTRRSEVAKLLEQTSD